MAKFVRLYSTSLVGTMMVNVDQVVCVLERDERTRIYFGDGNYTVVKETPDQVVALLTDPARDPGLHE